VTADLSDAELSTLIGLLCRITVGIDGPDIPVVSAWPVRRE